jgi:hypothetical protein
MTGGLTVGQTMLLSVAQYLDKADKCEGLARDAIKPARQTEYANLAAYYRFMATEVAKLKAAQASKVA